MVYEVVIFLSVKLEIVRHFLISIMTPAHE